MNRSHLLLSILVMAGTTYLIRLLPLVLFRKEIKSPFVRSFLFYIPFACLASMTFPEILYATDYTAAAIAAFAVAVFLALKKKSLPTVALAGCLTVFIVERLLVLL